MSSNERAVRALRTLGSMSGEGKRSRSGVEGIGEMALDAGIHAPFISRLARPSSTLQVAQAATATGRHQGTPP